MRKVGKESPCGFVRFGKRGQVSRDTLIDRRDDLRAPLAASHVHQRGSRGVAVFHEHLPGEVIVQVIMQ